MAPNYLSACVQHQRRLLPPDRGAEAGAHGCLQTSHGAQKASDAQSARAGGAAQQQSTRNPSFTAVPGHRAPGAAAAPGLRGPGLGAERPPGPTWCPSYLASSGSVKSRTGASAGGLKRSWGSALAAGSSSSRRREGSGSGPGPAAPAMPRSAHRPRPEARPAARGGTGVKGTLESAVLLAGTAAPACTALRGMGLLP